MEVVRDTLWEECLSNAVTMYRLSEPDDKCYNLADATWKLKVAYMKHQHKRDTRKIVVLEKKPEIVNEQRTSKKICCALTMSGSHVLLEQCVEITVKNTMSNIHS